MDNFIGNFPTTALDSSAGTFFLKVIRVNQWRGGSQIGDEKWYAKVPLLSGG